MRDGVTLRPYQEEAIAALEAQWGGRILIIEPDAGKVPAPDVFTLVEAPPCPVPPIIITHQKELLRMHPDNEPEPAKQQGVPWQDQVDNRKARRARAAKARKGDA